MRDRVVVPLHLEVHLAELQIHAVVVRRESQRLRERLAREPVLLRDHADEAEVVPGLRFVREQRGALEIRDRVDGAVLVSAPAYTGGSGPFGARAKMMGMPDKSDGPQSLAQGRFTIVTDGEILTNNSEDGAAPHARGRMLKWDVDAASAKVPEALVKL